MLANHNFLGAVLISKLFSFQSYRHFKNDNCLPMINLVILVIAVPIYCHNYNAFHRSWWVAMMQRHFNCPALFKHHSFTKISWCLQRSQKQNDIMTQLFIYCYLVKATEMSLTIKSLTSLNSSHIKIFIQKSKWQLKNKR